MTTPAIAISGLRKTYRHTRGLLRRRTSITDALRGIDLTVERGELFGLLGPNGAGKTTLVKILTTLLLPTSGRARVLDLDVEQDHGILRHRIGFVLGGERGLYWRLSALDNLTYFADLYQIPPRVATRRIRELLERFELWDRRHDLVEQYSRGMRQRLHLARGLLNEPEVLFLDEPTIGLDPVAARQLRHLVRELADGGMTIFLTTHYMLEAEAVCDRIGIINHGSLVALDRPTDLKRRFSKLGVLVFEVPGLSTERLSRLRDLPGVSSVVVAERELSNVVTIQCAAPADLAAQLVAILEHADVHNVQVREATLEDAYVLLVSA